MLSKLEFCVCELVVTACRLYDNTAQKKGNSKKGPSTVSKTETVPETVTYTLSRSYEICHTPSPIVLMCRSWVCHHLCQLETCALETGTCAGDGSGFSGRLACCMSLQAVVDGVTASIYV